MTYLRFLPIAVICLLPALSFSNAAQAKNLSQTYEIDRAKVEDEAINGSAIIDLEGKVNVSSIMQEPLVACNTRWSFQQGQLGGITIDNYAIADIPQDVLKQVTLHSVKLGFAVPPLNDAMFSENTWYELSCDPGALEPADSEKYSFTVPGSPSWDKTFHVRDTYDGFDEEAATFADEATAKQIMIKLLDEGFLTDSDSARVLRAKVNLSPVKQWLDKQKKDAEEKLKEEETAKDESAGGDFWTGEEQTAKNGENDFWAGQETSESGDDDFWAGDTENVRNEREAKKTEQFAKEEKQRQKGKLVKFESNDLYGYKNDNGDIVIEAKFYRINDFSEGLATAKESKDALWGYINKSGRWVIPARFYDAGIFSEGLAGVEETRDNGWGYIDQEGNYVISPRYNNAEYFQNNRAIVALDDYSLIIDKIGKELYRTKGVLGRGNDGRYFLDSETIGYSGQCSSATTTYRYTNLSLDGTPIGTSTEEEVSTPQFCLRAR